MKALLIALAVVLPLRASAAPARRIGLQLWSLRQDLGNDVAKGLDEVRAFGITYVESHSTYGLTPAEFRRRLDERGLKATSAHFPYERLDKDLPGVVAEAKALGAHYVILPWLPDETFTAATAKDLATHLNAWGAVLRKAGLRLGYHPHGFEFVPVEGGGTAFDLLVRSTNPADVCFELDVFWAAHAGADPVKLLTQYPDRWKLLHIKDVRKGASLTPGKRSAPAEDNVAVGQGQIDWPALLRAAKKIGIDYYFIEDETSTPQQNIPISVAYLKAFEH